MRLGPSMPTSSADWKSWLGFNAVVLLLIALDLGVFHRRPRQMNMREAALWSVFWIGLALGFNAFVWCAHGTAKAQEFLLGYVMEKSLSVDNLFVFVLIFNYFVVPPPHQRRVLSLGILGALVMRAAFIGAGAVLLAKFHWMELVFGAFLIYTGVRMLRAEDEEEVKLADNAVVRLFRRLVPMTDEYHGRRFLLREAGRWLATPLLMVLVVVETSDVVFAVDSIPAIFGVTRDPYIVYTSNVCAILGLRALYFLLASMLTQFRFLKLGISVVLVFVGGKMLLGDESLPLHYRLEPGTSLLVVGSILLVTILGSVMIPVREDVREAPPPVPPPHGGDPSV